MRPGPMLDHEFARYRVAVWFSKKVLVTVPVVMVGGIVYFQMPIEAYGLVGIVVLQNWFIWRLLWRALGG